MLYAKSRDGKKGRRCWWRKGLGWRKLKGAAEEEQEKEEKAEENANGLPSLVYAAVMKS